MTANLEEQNFAMCAASRIFRESYAAAVSADGAYERVNEKINDLYREIKNRRGSFISTEAVIFVTATRLEISFEEAKLRHYGKSKDEIVKTKKAIRNNDGFWRAARKFDRDDKGGQKFVTQQREASKIVFCLSMTAEDWNLIFNIVLMTCARGFHLLALQKELMKQSKWGRLSGGKFRKSQNGRMLLLNKRSRVLRQKIKLLCTPIIIFRNLEAFW